jgi:ubiquinone/menaquinone biosynthesis C-methylase UbiE
VTPEDAVTLLAPAIDGTGGTWADLGAGEGTFTRALAELLGPTSRIYAVDRDPDAVAALKQVARTTAANVSPVMGDFALPFDPPGSALLDGMLFANSLHYVRDAKTVLARLVAWVKPGGRVVLVEYDRRMPNPWVPHPIPISRVSDLSEAAGLTPAKVVATRPSRYQGTLYVAVAERLKP